LQDATNVLKKSCTLNNNVFSLFLNVVRVVDIRWSQFVTSL